MPNITLARDPPVGYIQVVHRPRRALFLSWKSQPLQTNLHSCSSRTLSSLHRHLISPSKLWLSLCTIHHGRCRLQFAFMHKHFSHCSGIGCMPSASGVVFHRTGFRNKCKTYHYQHTCSDNTGRLDSGRGEQQWARDRGEEWLPTIWKDLSWWPHWKVLRRTACSRLHWLVTSHESTFLTSAFRLMSKCNASPGYSIALPAQVISVIYKK